MNATILPSLWKGRKGSPQFVDAPFFTFVPICIVNISHPFGSLHLVWFETVLAFMQQAKVSVHYIFVGHIRSCTGHNICGIFLIVCSAQGCPVQKTANYYLRLVQSP